MEALWGWFAEAHNELMEQTGWDTVVANLTSMVRDAPALARGVYQEAVYFRYSINWQEPFFKYLLGFHLVMIAIVAYLVLWRWAPKQPRREGVTRAMELATSRAEEKLFALAVFLALLACAAFPLNALGNRYGHLIFADSNVNYFEDNWLFVGVLVWLPLVILSLLVQLKLLFNVLRLLVVAKAEQVKRQRRAAETKGSGGAETLSAGPNEESEEAQSQKKKN